MYAVLRIGQKLISQINSALLGEYIFKMLCWASYIMEVLIQLAIYAYQPMRCKVELLADSLFIRTMRLTCFGYQFSIQLTDSY